MVATDFWDVHGMAFVLCMCFLPRVTIVFMASARSIPIDVGLLSFTGWWIAPRLTVAIVATPIYWDTNPALIILTWVWAVVGEVLEKLIGWATSDDTSESRVPGRRNDGLWDVP